MQRWLDILLAVALLAIAVGAVLHFWPGLFGQREDESVSPIVVSDLASVPTEGRRIAIAEGAYHPGELSEADPLWNDSLYVEAWEIAGRTDREVSIAITSTEFEASFLVSGPGLDTTVVAEEWSCGARLLDFPFPQAAPYRVIVTSREPRGTGSFTLRASTGRLPCRIEEAYTDLPTDGRRLALGEEVRGELTTDDHLSTGGYLVQAWELSGRRGISTNLELISYEFESALAVVGPGVDGTRSGRMERAGGCTRRLTVRFPGDGSYRVIVSNQRGDAFATGAFLLRASDRPGPHLGLYCLWLLEAREVPFRGDLELGRTVVDELTPEDSAVWAHRVHVWRVAGERGETRTFDLDSEDLDMALVLVGGRHAYVDEDGGGGCSDRITVSFPEDGTYRVIVTNERGDYAARGKYSLLMSATPGPKREGECWRRGQGLIQPRHARLPIYDRRLTLGEEVRGELTTDDHRRIEGRGGTYVQAWGLEGQSGAPVTVDLISEDFNARLEVWGPGLDSPLTDSNGGGACHARVSFEFPEDGLYRVVVGTDGPPPIGEFRLRASRRPGPKAPGSC